MSSSHKSSSSTPQGSTSRVILTLENPIIIDAWDGKSYGNTKSDKDVFDEVIFNSDDNCTIQEWTDFTYEAINLAYGDLLDQIPNAHQTVNMPSITPRTIDDEDRIDDLGKAWTCNIIRASIKAAGAVLRRRPAVVVGGDPQKKQPDTDPVLGPRMSWSHPTLSQTELKPDWGFYDRKIYKKYYSAADKDGNKPLVFAIGDSKMCQKWKSTWLHKSLAGGYVDMNPAKTIRGKPISKTHKVTIERTLPLKQLASYCRFAETRYGFILTQEELVAFRVRRLNSKLLANTDDHKKAHAGIEYKSVPWDASGTDKLTVNLAIWVLGCMGMNEHHRVMETSDQKPLRSMVRLSKWTHDKAKKIYRNDISGREITEEDWKRLGNKVAFVHLDDRTGGVSDTITFTAGSVPEITQEMNALRLEATKKNDNNKPKPGNNRTASPAPNTGRASPAPNNRTASPAPNTSRVSPANNSTAPSTTKDKASSTTKDTASSSRTSSKPALEAKKYTIAGNKKPVYEMIEKDGKKFLNMGNKVEVTMDPKKNNQYYYINTKKNERVYLTPA